MDQLKMNCATNQTTANGTANESTPIRTLRRQLALSETGSISAPARTVSTPLPSSAKKWSILWIAICDEGDRHWRLRWLCPPAECRLRSRLRDCQPLRQPRFQSAQLKFRFGSKSHSPAARVPSKPQL